MHDPGGYVDVSTLLPFLVIFILVTLGIVNLVKLTAARFLSTQRSATEAWVTNKEESTPMLARHDVCAVCQEPSTKRCSQCKAVRYCSPNCQKEHWARGHKQECRPAKAPDPGDLKNVSGMFKNYVSLAKTPVTGMSLGPTSGISDGMLPKPKKVLFPYDEFIRLFNWDKLRLRPCGLINCGNSCFANVVLQCLTYTRPLVAYLLEETHMRTCSRNDWCFLCELQHHVRRVSQNEDPFSPIRILSRIPDIGGNLGYGRQEDAHEFMRFAIDSMQSICLDEVGGEKAVDPQTQETTLIQHIFGGLLQSQVKCTQCLRVSNTYENMMDLTVEIQGDVVSLDDALKQFTACEWLDGENKYKCDGCNAYVKAWKQLTIYQAPNVLTVALKRFQTGRFGKLNKRVTFPETLDLSPYVSRRGDGLHIYKLYAVVVHVDMLNASFFGHYICYIKDLQGCWYKIDDCKVKEVELEEVLSQRAYMVLYSRISVRPPPVAADISASAVIKGAKSDDFNLVASHGQSQCFLTDGSLPGPFEVVELLRSNLADAQESADENVEHSLSTRVRPGSSQKLNSVVGSLYTGDTESTSVEMTSESSGLLTSNSSCSEESSVKSGKRSFDASFYLDPKPLVTCSFPVVPARKHRSASCPPVLGRRLDFGIRSQSSSVMNVKHSVSLNHLNKCSNASVASVGVLSKNRLGDEKYDILHSEGPYLDTPRSSDLTEAGNSKILDFQSGDSDIECPEKMDCDYPMIHPAIENSCDGLLTVLEEPPSDEISESSSEHIPSSINTTLFSDENAEIPLHSSLGMSPLSCGNQHGIIPDHGDWYRHSDRTSDLIEADMMEKNKCDPEGELYLVKDTSVEMNFTEGTLGVDSLPDTKYSPVHLSCGSAAELIDSGQTQEEINSAPERGNSGKFSESVSLNREFPNLSGVSHEVADSSLDMGFSAPDLLFRPYEKESGIHKSGQDPLHEIPGIDIVDGSSSSPEFCVNSVDDAKFVASDSTKFGEPTWTPVEKCQKSKPIFAPGFLKREPRWKNVIDSRPSQNMVHTHGAGSAPDDVIKLEAPSSVQFDVDSGIVAMGSLPCETTSTEAGNNVKVRPLFAPGFLNRASATHSKSLQNKAVHAIRVDGSSENGVPKFQHFPHNEVISNGTATMHKSMAGDGTSDSAPFCNFNYEPEIRQLGMQGVGPSNVAAMPIQNEEEYITGNSFASNQKELIGSGRKRSLSSEFLHTEQGSFATMKTNGKITVAKQKQGRNGSCHCGSQRKWKKCCGRADVLEHR